MTEAATPTQKLKSTGHVTEISVDITEPLKMEAMQMNFGQLMIMVGKNGSGKSLINALVWAMSTIIQGAVVTGGKIPLVPNAQYTFDHTFDNKIDGTVKLFFQSGATIEVVLNKGVVKNVEVTGIEDLTVPVPTIYMSSNIRLFTSIKSYLTMRQFMIERKFTEEVVYEEMLKSYKLYDVLYIESLIRRMPVTVDDSMRKAFENFEITENIESFGVDLSKPDFYAVIDGEKKYLSTYGNGHQALFNMFLGNTIAKGGKA